MTALTRNDPSAISAAIEKKLLHDLGKGFRNAAREYRKAANKAVENDHPVEAAMCDHLSKLLCKPLSSLREVSEVLKECKELNAWLPVPGPIRMLSRIERQGRHVGFIHRLELSLKDKDSLIQLATQRPGRPPEAREVTVRAMELHMKGLKWKDIEPQLLPHRGRDMANPGRSINREVQFLNTVLKRYGVRVEQLRVACPENAKQFPDQNH